MNVKVKAPAGCDSFSWGGEEFKCSKKGIASVPAEAVEDLRPHGIVPATEHEDAPAAEESAAPAAQ